jgi:steroid delta-isomerase-like uncharacterized protein
MKNLIYILVIAVCFASCNNMADQAANNKEAANKERVKQFYEQVINAHNPDMVDSFCSADFVDHNPEMNHTGKGIEELKTVFREFFTAYPDVHMNPDFMVAEDDKVVAHIIMTGTNTGPMGNMPATNKSIHIEGIDIIQIKGDKASDRWGFFDSVKMLTQLGIMPPPGAMPDSAMMKAEEMKK